MTALHFTISFHGPFHIARGQAAQGLDRTVDRVVPLPASSIKGLLRAEAREQLGIRSDLVDAIFGNRVLPCPWAFSDAEIAPLPEDRSRVRRAARIKVDKNGQASNRFLMLGEQVWATAAEFTIEQAVPGIARVEDHVLVLTAAAQSVTSLGGARRRGEGWVSIMRDDIDQVWDDHSSASLITLMGANE